MKKEVKINFHSAVGNGTKEFICKCLQSKFTPVVTEDYDYYFAMESIYHGSESMNELLDSKSDAIRIMCCGEAVFPDMNLFDYAIWNCDTFELYDRIIMLPLIETEKGSMLESFSELDDSKKDIDAKIILKEKTKFCNFIYSNPKAHPMRDALFYEISKYKKVDSLGMHLKNTEIEDTRNMEGWEKISIQLKSKYKFSIAAENAKFVGYTSEKLMTSMMANTIPIYWGNPMVGKWFNEKSFINAMDYDSPGELIDRIKEIDQNDDLYCEIISQPWRTEEQIIACNDAIEKAYIQIENIFIQDKAKAKRRPEGCWPDIIYPNFMRHRIEKVDKKNVYVSQIKDRLLKLLV